jgi:glycosyltransferase involved in cell wall biosynthesis
MSAHLIAMILSHLSHLPWVADFRDPWRGNPFRDLGASSIERWDDFLEWIVVKSASYVICNTPAMTEELRRRRPFVNGKTTTILNGFDPELLEGINPKRVVPADAFALTHTGQFYGPRSPVVWFRAFRRALDRTPEPAARIHMVLVGPEQFGQRHLRDWAREAGVERNVHVLGRKSHAETLSYLAGSNALMLPDRRVWATASRFPTSSSSTWRSANRSLPPARRQARSQRFSGRLAPRHWFATQTMTPL